MSHSSEESMKTVESNLNYQRSDCELCQQTEDDQILVSVTPKILSLPELGSSNTDMMIKNKSPFSIFFKINSTNLYAFRPYPKTGKIYPYGIVIITIRFYNSSIPIRQHEEINILVSTHPFAQLKDRICHYCHRYHLQKYQNSSLRKCSFEKTEKDRTRLKHSNKDFEIVIMCKNCNQFVISNDMEIEKNYECEKGRKISGILSDHICEFKNGHEKQFKGISEKHETGILRDHICDFKNGYEGQFKRNDNIKEIINRLSPGSKIIESEFKEGSNDQNMRQKINTMENQSDYSWTIPKTYKTFKQIELDENDKRKEKSPKKDFNFKSDLEDEKVLEKVFGPQMDNGECDKLLISVKKDKRKNGSRKDKAYRASEDIYSEIKHRYMNSNRINENHDYHPINLTYEIKHKITTSQNSVKCDCHSQPHICARILQADPCLIAVDRRTKNTVKNSFLGNRQMLIISESNVQPSEHALDEEFESAIGDDVIVSKYTRQQEYYCEKKMMLLENRCSKILLVAKFSLFLIVLILLLMVGKDVTCVAMKKCVLEAKEIVFNLFFL